METIIDTFFVLFLGFVIIWFDIWHNGRRYNDMEIISFGEII